MITKQEFTDTIYIFADEIIENYLIDIDLMTKDREVNHYEK